MVVAQPRAKFRDGIARDTTPTSPQGISLQGKHVIYLSIVSLKHCSSERSLVLDRKAPSRKPTMRVMQARIFTFLETTSPDRQRCRLRITMANRRLVLLSRIKSCVTTSATSNRVDIVGTHIESPGAGFTTRVSKSASQQTSKQLSDSLIVLHLDGCHITPAKRGAKQCATCNMRGVQLLTINF